VPIVPSQSRRIQELLGRLASQKSVDRDSAVAQLTLLGPRVLEPLLAALPASGLLFRRAALEVLDRLRDKRALPEVLALAEDRDPEVAQRALALAAVYPDLRTARGLAKLLASGPSERRRAAARSLALVHGAGIVEAIEPLLDVLLDEDEEEGLRLAILDDLAGLDPPLDPRTLPPLLKRLRDSHDPAVAARSAALLRRSQSGEPEGGDRLHDLLERVAAPGLPPEEADRLASALASLSLGDTEALHRALERTRAPLAVRVLADALGQVGTNASIPVLRRALERLGYEGGEPPPEAAEPRAHAKANVHYALARLDSRIALFDLRQMLAARPPRALRRLLAAAVRIGDGSFVPALARLAAELPEHFEAAAEAFVAIVRRERLRPASRALRGVRAPDRPALLAFWAKAEGAFGPVKKGAPIDRRPTSARKR
jgi:HEAT repeat protein